MNLRHLWETITHPATSSLISLIDNSDKCRHSCNDISMWNQLKEHLIEFFHLPEVEDDTIWENERNEKNNRKEKIMSPQTSDNNKRIAKNTLLLYFRILFMMVVSLYTSRVILNSLGVDDFGIHFCQQ